MSVERDLQLMAELRAVRLPQPMNDFSFQYRLRFTRRSNIQFDAPRLELEKLPEGRSIVLAAADDETPLKSARDVVLGASGWKSLQEAESSGKNIADRLTIAFVRHRIGVHPIGTVSVVRFFNSGLKMLEAKVGERVLTDIYGLSVFTTEPPARFARMEASASIGIKAERLKLTSTQLA